MTLQKLPLEVSGTDYKLKQKGLFTQIKSHRVGFKKWQNTFLVSKKKTKTAAATKTATVKTAKTKNKLQNQNFLFLRILIMLQT